MTDDRPASRRPVRLRPPPRLEQPSAQRSSRPSTARRTRGWVTAAALAAAVVALVVVFVALPQWVENRDLPTPAPLPTPLPEAVPTANGVDAGTEVEDLRARVAVLEERHAWVWAGPEWAAVRDRMAAVEAGIPDPQHFAELEQRLAELEAAALPALQSALEQGRTALARGDAEAARRAFELALRIEPSSTGASAGLRRVEVHDQAFRLVETAMQRERDGDLRGAREAAREVLAQDPSSTAAQEVLARSERHLADRLFAEAMSEGLAALDDQRFAAARAAFTRASELRPGASEAADGLVRVEAGELHAAVGAGGDRASALEAAERWSEAAKEYAGILALDGSLDFARSGEQRCRDRARLAAELDQHLNNPGRLATEEVLEAAQELLAEARSVEPQGAGHRDRVERLATAVRLASTPVPVTLTSDGLTEVVIYRVGQLGAFSQQVVELRPGTWVVVGRREGFRDVRREIRVEAGSRPSVDIRCTEGV